MDLISTSGVIIIEDNLECRGLKFLFALFNNLLKTFDKALAVCDEIGEHHFEKLFSPDELSRVEKFYFKDSNCGKTFPNIAEIIEKCEKHLLNSHKSVVAFDSLSSLFVNYGCDQTVQLLHNLHHCENSKVTVLAIVHNDCASSEDILKLQWLASTWYSVEWCNKTSSALLHAKICKNHGEIRRKSVKLTVTEDLNLKFTPIDQQIDRQSNEFTSKSTQPSPNLTFNVGIKQSEMVAKKNLVLPYVKTNTEKETGKVIYVPDKEDDIDEEDPDEDLDF